MRNVVGSLALAVVVMFGSGSASADEIKAAPSTNTVAAATKTSPKRVASRSDVSVGAALARCDDSTMQRPGSGTSPTRSSTPAPAPAMAASAIVEVQEGRGLADIHVAQSHASGRAGTARDVQLTVAPDAKAARPVATVRMQRRMNVDRAMASVATAIEACRASAGAGAGVGVGVATVAVQLDVSATGEVEKAEMASMKGSMAKPVVSCVLAALGNARFGAPGPMGASLTVPVSLGQDRGDVTRLASAE